MEPTAEIQNEFPETAESGGRHIGRMMILDLARAFRNSVEGRGREGLLSEEHKADLINSLTEAEDILTFNDYRYVYEFLARTSLAFQLQAKTAEAAYWKLRALLDPLEQAETAYLRLARAFNLLPEEGEAKNPGRTKKPARLPTPLFPETPGAEETPEAPPAGPAAARPPAFFRRARLSPLGLTEEFLLSRGQEFKEFREEYAQALRECYVLTETVRLIGEMVQVPDVAYSLAAVDLDPCRILNNIMAAIVRNIRRCGLYEGENTVGNLRAGLGQIFLPLDPQSLRPTAAAIKKARRLMDFTIVQGRTETLYAALRGSA